MYFGALAVEPLVAMLGLVLGLILVLIGRVGAVLAGEGGVAGAAPVVVCARTGNPINAVAAVAIAIEERLAMVDCLLRSCGLC
jgi:hypothetical protein